MVSQISYSVYDNENSKPALDPDDTSLLEIQRSPKTIQVHDPSPITASSFELTNYGVTVSNNSRTAVHGVRLLAQPGGDCHVNGETTIDLGGSRRDSGLGTEQNLVSTVPAQADLGRTEQPATVVLTVSSSDAESVEPMKLEVRVPPVVCPVLDSADVTFDAGADVLARFDLARSLVNPAACPQPSWTTLQGASATLETIPTRKCPAIAVNVSESAVLFTIIGVPNAEQSCESANYIVEATCSAAAILNESIAILGFVMRDGDVSTATSLYAAAMADASVICSEASKVSLAYDGDTVELKRCDT